MNLGELKVISAVKVQGHSRSKFYVETLKLLFSEDGVMFSNFWFQNKLKVSSFILIVDLFPP